MFEQNGLMKNTLMSVLKKTLHVVMSERIADISDTIVFDVSALMWTIQWPSDVVFVFDRYFEGSTKVHVLEHIETNERGDVPRSCAF